MEKDSNEDKGTKRRRIIMNSTTYTNMNKIEL